jgi:polyvinyl alcohol dehydrogenase (cytochrome)
MKNQGMALNEQEKEKVALFISKINTKAEKIQPGNCFSSIPNSSNTSDIFIENWGMNIKNNRFLKRNQSSISAKNVHQLKLKWAFAFPEATRARCQPTIAGNVLFTANQHGLLYALDRFTGCILWTFQADAEVRSAISIAYNELGNAQTLYFADFKANVYALDLKSNKLLWKILADPHPQATITGSLQVYNNKLYIPISSTEVVAAYNPNYECCTFRGSVLALDAKTGTRIWKTYTVEEEPTETGKNSKNISQFAPSGAPVWSSPTIDENGAYCILAQAKITADLPAK